MDDLDVQLTSYCGSVLLSRLANIFVQPQSGVFDEIIFSHSHGKTKTLKQSDYHLYKAFMNPLLKQPLVRAAVKFPRAMIQRAHGGSAAGTYFKATSSPGSSPPATGKKKGLLSWVRG